MIVKLSNGEAQLKPFIDRKTMKLYRKALFVNSKTALDPSTGEPKIEFDMTSMDEANDVIVNGLVQKVIIDGKEHTENLENILAEMNTIDFEKILVETTALMKAKEEEKKS